MKNRTFFDTVAFALAFGTLMIPTGLEAEASTPTCIVATQTHTPDPYAPTPTPTPLGWPTATPTNTFYCYVTPTPTPTFNCMNYGDACTADPPPDGCKRCVSALNCENYKGDSQMLGPVNVCFGTTGCSTPTPVPCRQEHKCYTSEELDDHTCVWILVWFCQQDIGSGNTCYLCKKESWWTVVQTADESYCLK